MQIEKKEKKKKTSKPIIVLKKFDFEWFQKNKIGILQVRERGLGVSWMSGLDQRLGLDKYWMASFEFYAINHLIIL